MKKAKLAFIAVALLSTLLLAVLCWIFPKRNVPKLPGAFAGAINIETRCVRGSDSPHFEKVVVFQNESSLVEINFSNPESHQILAELPDGSFHGKALFACELKEGHNRLTPAQLKFIRIDPAELARHRQKDDALMQEIRDEISKRNTGP